MYSGLILKELKYKLANETIFKEKVEFFKKLKCRYAILTPEDYSLARELKYPNPEGWGF